VNILFTDIPNFAGADRLTGERAQRADDRRHRADAQHLLRGPQPLQGVASDSGLPCNQSWFETLVNEQSVEWCVVTLTKCGRNVLLWRWCGWCFVFPRVVQIAGAYILPS
jgi:hypothetical protein